MVRAKVETLKDLKWIITNIQRFCIHDGPGIRTVVFMKGCPLRCFWCCNPENQRAEREVFYDSRKCIGCRRCVEICPKKALSFSVKGVILNRGVCIGCGFCCNVCPSGALFLVGNLMTVDEVVKEVIRDAAFYSNSGGGVTISGGEPLFSKKSTAFVRKLLEFLKEKNIHTAIETSGFTKWDLLESILPFCDLFLYDIKHLDSKGHQEGTGVPNELIVSNLRNLASLTKNIVLRFPLIPGFNDDINIIKSIGELAKDVGLYRLDILPYHLLGKRKYVFLGRDDSLIPDSKPREEFLFEVKKALETEFCLVVKVGG
jgi:pyruvate formate lyase activating enzyme